MPQLVDTGYVSRKGIVPYCDVDSVFDADKSSGIRTRLNATNFATARRRETGIRTGISSTTQAKSLIEHIDNYKGIVEGKLGEQNAPMYDDCALRSQRAGSRNLRRDSIRTGNDPNAELAREAFDYLRNAGDGAQFVLDSKQHRLGGLKFSAKGFLRRQHREDPVEVAERRARQAEREERQAANSDARRRKLSELNYGEGFNLLTHTPVRASSAPPRRVGLRRLASGNETVLDSTAAARMMDSGLRYYLPVHVSEPKGGDGDAGGRLQYRRALLAREGMTEASVHKLRRSSLLGIGRLDLPSAGAADALEAAQYGGHGGAQSVPAEGEIRRSITKELRPIELLNGGVPRSDASMAAAAADATMLANARRLARSARQPNTSRVFDSDTRNAALLPALKSGFTRFASAEEEAIAATAAARRVLATTAAGSDSAVPSSTASNRRSTTAAATTKEIDAVRALVL